MGGFAIANNLPPRWKPSEHITHTPREVFRRLTQCRTKHAFVGEYYAKFIPDKSIGCRCGKRFQTQEHIIKECQDFEEYRDILRKADKQLELGIILGTKKGLETMVKFLGKSDAFTKSGRPQTQDMDPTEDNKENDEEGSWWERMERTGRWRE
ncbi:hypothetical protein J132_05347 [Termitomyces sp. J132]|nr:hypothetical protein J132_05347 [Termitomyces sp. J132]